MDRFGLFWGWNRRGKKARPRRDIARGGEIQMSLELYSLVRPEREKEREREGERERRGERERERMFCQF